jgi:predicted MFS family arabinose efflux permease
MRLVTPHRYLLALLFCGYATAFVDRGLVSVVAAPLQRDLGLSDTQLGLVNGMAFVASYCVCGIPLGWLVDRVNRRALIGMSLLFWSIMTAVCALADSFGEFFLARVGVGLGEAGLVPAAISLLGSEIPRGKMARSVAIFIMGATVGNAVALLAGGQLLNLISSTVSSHWGFNRLAPWRALFLVAAVPGVALAALFVGVHEPPRPTGSVRLLGALRAALAVLYTNRAAYGPLCIATACILTLSQTQAAWIPLLYGRVFHLSPGDAAVLVGVMFVVSAPAGQYLGGILIDLLRAHGMADAPHLIQAGGSVLCIPAAVIFCSSTRIGVSMAGYILFNLLVFAATPAGMTGWQLLTPRRCQGLVIALLLAVVTLIGVGVGPVVVGALTDRIFGGQNALGTSLLLVIFVAGTIGFFAALWGRGAFIRSLSTTEATNS